MGKNILLTLLWGIACIIGIISIVFFVNIMGYSSTEVSIFEYLEKYDRQVSLFYIFSIIATLLFGTLVIINRKLNNLKQLFIAVICCVVQLILIIYKVKL